MLIYIACCPDGSINKANIRYKIGLFTDLEPVIVCRTAFISVYNLTAYALKTVLSYAKNSINNNPLPLGDKTKHLKDSIKRIKENMGITLNTEESCVQ